jgi:hypothetical protein
VDTRGRGPMGPIGSATGGHSAADHRPGIPATEDMAYGLSADEAGHGFDWDWMPADPDVSLAQRLHRVRMRLSPSSHVG